MRIGEKFCNGIVGNYFYCVSNYVFFISLGKAQERVHRLEKFVGLPKWFSFNGETRIMYETLNNQFRVESLGSDQALSLRTLAKLEWRLPKKIKIRLELQDSRAELGDSGSVMNTTIVNPLELLEANLAWETLNLFSEGDRFSLRGGRLTMDIGNRRFIARNRFRNVIQAFTGIDAKWNAADETLIRTIFTMPVNRQPTALSQLLRNRIKFDEETTNFFLWGGFVSFPKLFFNDTGEVYFFGVKESDGPS